MANRKILRIKRTIKPTAESVSITNGVSEPTDGDESIITGSVDTDGGETDDSGSIEEFDPTIIAGTENGNDNGSDTRKRRGRKPGSKNTPKNKTQNSENIEKLLFSIHIMGATFLHAPEFVLSEDEAKQLADAIQQVNNLYDIPVIPPWVTAYANLGITAVGIYGPRIVAMKFREKKSREIAKPVVVPQPAQLIVNPSKVGIPN